MDKTLYDSLGQFLSAGGGGLGRTSDRDERFEPSYEGVVFRDRGFDGTLFDLDFLYDQQISLEIFLGEFSGRRDFSLSLSSLSEPTYRYYKELNIARFGGGPFREPVVLASNVEGGDGHFIVETRTAAVEWEE